MVNGLVTPSMGEVLVAGKNTQGGDTVALRRSIGYVIQETGAVSAHDRGAKRRDGVGACGATKAGDRGSCA